MTLAVKMNRGLILRYLIIGAGVLIYGGWCIKDGWFNPEFQTPEKTAGRRYSMVGSVVFPLLGLGLIFWAGSLSQKRLIADEVGLRMGRRCMAWTSVTKVDDAELEAHGLLKVHYKDEKAGEELIWVLDQYQFTDFEALLDYLEANVPPYTLPKSADSAQAEKPQGA